MAEQLGLAIDRLDNFIAGLVLSMPDHLHVRALREGLPGVAADLRAAMSKRRSKAGNQPDGSAADPRTGDGIQGATQGVSAHPVQGTVPPAPGAPERAEREPPKEPCLTVAELSRRLAAIPGEMWEEATDGNDEREAWHAIAETLLPVLPVKCPRGNYHLAHPPGDDPDCDVCEAGDLRVKLHEAEAKFYALDLNLTGMMEDFDIVVKQRDEARRKLDAEHARRCDLEKRFDYRIEGSGVVDRARDLCGRTVLPDRNEMESAVLGLVQLIEAREAAERGPPPGLVAGPGEASCGEPMTPTTCGFKKGHAGPHAYARGGWACARWPECCETEGVASK